MSKDFFKMTSKERDAEAKKWEKGVSFDETKPLSAKNKQLWQAAKRGRGRPPKAGHEKAKRFIVSMDPAIFKMVTEYVAESGIDRSKLTSMSLLAFLYSAAAQKAILGKSSDPSATTNKKPALVVAKG